MPDQFQVVDQPNIMIIEGLNVLQTWDDEPEHKPRVFVSDFFDFTIYVDAAVQDVREWYIERFLTLRYTAFSDPASYFHRYASLSDQAARQRSHTIWTEINEVNLLENILPTRERADLIRKRSGSYGAARETA